MRLDGTLGHAAPRVEAALDALLPPANDPPRRLHEAMRYAALGGGKRLRPMLVYASAQAAGGVDEWLDGPASAVELIHCYSLVHDDLPAMDDDALRRGRATCHRAFDEATALLVGDALHSLAFAALTASPDIPASQRVTMVQTLADAAGTSGMAGGQAMDLAATGQALDSAALEAVHARKTGALIRAAIRLGALCQPAPGAGMLERLDHYGRCIGLAFQVQDDILDVTGDEAVTGKPPGGDARLAKPTYPQLLGLERARGLVTKLCDQALGSLDALDSDTDGLRQIARYLSTRDR